MSGRKRPRRREPEITVTWKNGPPTKDDPRVLDLVRAMADDQARIDHKAEMKRLSEAGNSKPGEATE